MQTVIRRAKWHRYVVTATVVVALYYICAYALCAGCVVAELVFGCRYIDDARDV